MRLKNLRLKIKGMRRLRRLLNGIGRKKSRKEDNWNRNSWVMNASHGYQVVELGNTSFREDDSVVVQREQIEDCELWFYGVFDDDAIRDGITKYMRSNFFTKMPKESRMGKKCKEAMKRAHMNARSKIINRDEAEAYGKSGSGSASAMVINCKTLVMANMGGYKAVICRDGEAYEICRKKQQPTKRNWPFILISGGLHVPKVYKTAGDTTSTKSFKSSQVVVGSERIDSETEFVILASSGVWQVMKQQEAVNLIRHIEDPQAAAECLATEALNRMSKSKISCLIIRFH